MENFLVHALRRPESLDRQGEGSGYVVRRIDAGAPLREVVREEHVRRNATRGETERLLTDPRIVGGARERMRRDLGCSEPPTRRTPPPGRPGASPRVGTWRHPGERR